MSNFYLTTTLPYVNAEPHIGFALEIVAADVLARHQKSLGNNVFFNTGTDEHGQKIYEKALEHNQSPQKYVDHFATSFKALQPLLGLSQDLHFIRTTATHHKAAAQTFWKHCAANTNEQGEPDIYLAEYETLYCVGCELEKQASELTAGRCPLHPTQELEQRLEQNYFFRFSRYQAALLELYRTTPEFVRPKGKMTEIAAFVAGGLQDFSISRLKSKMPWGVPVPGDENHVMYVWFDALINYISTLGWPENTERFEQFWPGIQLAGKDNLRQQAAMWQAMLLSAKLPCSKTILINGFISVAGQKMSKSLGNVISPAQMTERYGQEATRYILMSLGPFGEDIDVTWQRFDEVYTTELANSLGNTCSRLATLCEKYAVSGKNALKKQSSNTAKASYDAALKNFEIQQALEIFREAIRTIENYLSTHQPWKAGVENRSEVLEEAVRQLVASAQLLEPIMPTTAAQITAQFSRDTITRIQPLFPRLPQDAV